MTSESRSLVVDGLANARDLGGLPLAGGGVTPHGVFVRSESPDRVPRAGWEELQRLGVRTVVDLRQEVERTREPSAAPEDLQVVAVDHDGLAEHADFWSDYWDNGLVGTPLYYLPHLRAMPERTVAVLSAIATAEPGGVLVHCGAGRDRTGLVCAVLLVAAGVEPDAVTADYLESITNMPRVHERRGRPDQEPGIAELLRSRGTDSATAFRAFLDALDVDALLARLPTAEATAIRTWRGAVPPR